MTSLQPENFPHRQRPHQRRQASRLRAAEQGGPQTTLTLEADGSIVLDQTVRRGDRAAMHRPWRLKPVGPRRYEGTLTDAAGPVTGETEGGRRLHLSFSTKGHLHADQWLTLAFDGRSASNVLVFKKLGIPVASLEETILKRP